MHIASQKGPIKSIWSLKCLKDWVFVDIFDLSVNASGVFFDHHFSDADDMSHFVFLLLRFF